MEKGVGQALRRENAISLSVIDWAGRTDSLRITGEVFRRVGLPDTPQNSCTTASRPTCELPAAGTREPVQQGRVLPGVLELPGDPAPADDLAQGLLTGNLRRGAEFKLTHYKVWHYFEFGAFADDSPRRNDLGPHAPPPGRRSGTRVDFDAGRTVHHR